MTGIPLNALRTFEAVATRLSFAKGAEALNVTPAAVSSQIRALEERLNQTLFHRHGRRVELTEAGGKLLAAVDNTMSHGIKLADEAQHAAVGADQHAHAVGPRTQSDR